MSERWTRARKADVVNAIREGRITREAAMKRYEMSAEELASWERRYEVLGLAGLAATGRFRRLRT